MAKRINFDVTLQDHGAKKGFDELDKAIGRTSVTAKGQLTPTVNEANYGLMNMSRIVQDAPYGLRGMGNNITFVTEQMAHMKAQGIGVTAQLKGMLAAMAGPGGVIFVVSAITSLLTYFTMNTSSASKEVNKLTDALEKQRSEMAKQNAELKQRMSMSYFMANAGRLQQLTESQTAIESQILGMNQVIGSSTSTEAQKFQAMITRGNLQKQLEQVNAEIWKIDLAWDSVKNKYRDLVDNQKQLTTSVKEQKKAIQDMVGIYTVAYGNVSSAFAANPSATTGPGGLPVGLQPVGRKPGVDLKDYYNTRERFERQFINSSASLMRSEFNAAWDSIFGHANSFFEKMIQNWASLIVQQIGSNIFSGVPILSGLGGIASIFGLARTTTEANKVAQAYNINE